MSTVHVVVSVGTDHHPFDRLLDWVERWVTQQDASVELTVQHGSSRPVAGARNVRVLPPDELRALYARAGLVVTQVGPGTIADANGAGRRPIVVPRDPALGEVVDRHQFAYGAFMDRRGRAWCATTEGALHRVMDAGVADVESTRLRPVAREVEATAARLASVLEGIAAAPAGWFSPGRVADLLPRRGRRTTVAMPTVLAGAHPDGRPAPPEDGAGSPPGHPSARGGGILR